MTTSESVDDLVEFWHRAPTVLLDDAAREVLAKIEARVRAEVAEEIATVLDRCSTQAGNVMPFTADAYSAAAAIAREHAGSSPDTTPEGRDA
jgi:hypothetical protein